MFLMYYPKMDLFSCFDLQSSETSCSPPGGLSSRTGVDTTPSLLVNNSITLTAPYANNDIPTCSASANPPAPAPVPAPVPAGQARFVGSLFNSVCVLVVFALLA